MVQQFRDPQMTAYLRDLREQYRQGRVSRRDVIRWGAMLGVSLAGFAFVDGGPLAAAQDATPTTGGTLRCTSFPMTQIEPPLLENVGAAATVHLVCEQLMRVGPDLVLRPHLAESWEASADAKTWTFKLRQGVTFNNGAPFSADDVIWTFNNLLDEETASSARSTLTYLTPEGIERVDDHTVAFHLDRSVAVFPYDITNYMIVMLPKDWPGDFPEQPDRNRGVPARRVRQQRPCDVCRGTRTTGISRCPTSTGSASPTRQASKPRSNALLSGQADVVLFPTEAPLIQTMREDRRHHGADREVVLLQSNPHAQRPAAVQDNRVREAFKYMVDRQQLVTFVLGGDGDIGNDHMVAPVYPEFTDNGVRAQDYDKAKALLAEAGHPDGFEMEFYGLGRRRRQAGPADGRLPADG